MSLNRGLSDGSSQLDSGYALKTRTPLSNAEPTLCPQGFVSGGDLATPLTTHANFEHPVQKSSSFSTTYLLFYPILWGDTLTPSKYPASHPSLTLRFSIC